jgi:P-type Mg2+ transporter
MLKVLSSFWNAPVEQVLQQLESTPQGLSRKEAQQRLLQYGANRLRNSSLT